MTGIPAKYIRQIAALAFSTYVLSGCETITTTRFYFANNWTNHRFEQAEIPFKRERVVIIPISVNDGTVLDFALDTGSPAIAIIGHEKTETLNLTLGANVQLGGSGSGQTPVGQIVNDIQVSTGNMTLLDQTAVWIPWDQVSFFDTEQHVFIDGIIGYDLFKRFVVELDFDRMIMNLYPPENFEYDGKGESFELTMHSRKPYMMAKATMLDGRTTDVKLHVDLGSSGNITLIPDSKPEIEIPAKTVSTPSWGMSGKATAGLGRIKKLKLGSYELDSVLTRFPYSGYSMTADRQGVIGIGVLGRFKVIIDYERNRMILESTAKTFEGFIPNRTGLGLSRYGDGYIINYILPETAASEKDLAKGDILESLNGRLASELSRQELDSMLRLESGMILDLCVLRDGDQLCLALELMDPGI